MIAASPKRCSIHVDVIPAEITDPRQWVLWRFERRAGQDKPTKVPYAVSGGKADSTDPTTWSPFAAALQRYQAGGFDGIGFVFAPDDGFCGVDLDDCRNPETGELEPWAAEIVARLNTYC